MKKCLKCGKEYVGEDFLCPECMEANRAANSAGSAKRKPYAWFYGLVAVILLSLALAPFTNGVTLVLAGAFGAILLLCLTVAIANTAGDVNEIKLLLQKQEEERRNDND